MSTIEYEIEVPQKAMDLLANIYSPTKKECAVMNVVDYENERKNNPFYWRFSKFWHKHAKDVPDEDIRKDQVDKYWKDREKVSEHRRKGRVYRKNSLFYRNATSIKELIEQTGESEDHVRTFMREQLFGLIGIVVDSFSHHIQTGSSEKDSKIFAYLPNNVPVYGRPIRVIKYSGVYIPFPVADNVQKGIDCGPDERGFFQVPMHINESSLPVLSYTVKRTRELEEKKLREKGKSRRNYVEFHDSELARVIGINRKKTKEAIRDLLGVVVEAVHPINMERYSNKVFLPSCRRELAEDLLRFA
jgi:hypothetical protein